MKKGPFVSPDERPIIEFTITEVIIIAQYEAEMRAKIFVKCVILPNIILYEFKTRQINCKR